MNPLDREHVGLERADEGLAPRQPCRNGLRDPVAAKNGVFYAIDRLSARRVFPMHGDGEEYWYAEFAAEAAKAGIRVPVTCVEFEGDHVTIQPGSPTRGR